MAATVKGSSPEATCLPQPRVGKGFETVRNVLTNRLEDLHLILGTHIVEHGSLTICNPIAREVEAVGSLGVDQMV